MFISSLPYRTASFLVKLFPKKISPTPSTSGRQTPLRSGQLPTIAISNNQSPTPKPTITIIPTNIIPTTKIPTLTPTPKSIACPKISTQSYQNVQTNSDYTLNGPAETHPEINLRLRGYVEVNEKAGLVHYGGDTDPLALKINSIFSDGRKPTIIKTYQVHAWDYVNNKPSSATENAWPVSLIGLSATPGEPLVVPPSGRNISGSLELMVLYADENRVTFTNSLGDNWTDGYIFHVEDICTDPNLISAYQNANASGRGSLPALSHGQVFGTAKNNEVKVAIRDSGTFMDPRSDKDWW